MSELKALKCQCCGGKINRKTMKCEYCGTEYIIKDDTVLRIETFTSPVKTIRARMSINDEQLYYAKDLEDFMEFCVRDLARQVAEQMYDTLKIKVSAEPQFCIHTLDAEARVIVPVMTKERWREEFGR